MGHIAPTLQQDAVAATKLFADGLIWDNHACPTLRPANAAALAELRRHKDAGVDVVCINVGFDAAPREDPIILLADFRRWLRSHSDQFILVESVQDIERARAERKLAVCFNLEGGRALYGHASMVSLYYDLGVRWMLFAYNRNNELAGGCQDTDSGLTDLGREVIVEMERVGMVICCSHIGDRSAMEILELASKPVIFSHSNPQSLWRHPRNISDAAIRACARTGGVIGINGVGIFLGNNDIRVERIIEHIDYVVDLVGVAHVGIALDYAYEFDEDEVRAYFKAHPETFPPDSYPDGGILLMPPERLPSIAEHLLKRGYSGDDVRNIMGGNHLRIARSVWK